MARCLQAYAKEDAGGESRNFVMISSEKGPFFAPMYITTKREAEKYLLEECPSLNVTIVRPGVILNTQERMWGVPVGIANDIAYHFGE